MGITMNELTLLSVVEALLQLSMIIMVGLYFIFSNTVMGVLSKRNDGAAIMIDINAQILNPVFLGCFVLSGVAGLYFFVFHSGFQSMAGLLFFIGTTLVTIVFNVPLNNLLRDTPQAGVARVWESYLKRWGSWNHVRTTSAVCSGLLLSL